MPHLKDIRTSLEVGFPENGVPEAFFRYRGKVMRTIEAVTEFPFEDAQFEVVLMDGAAVSAARVREAHRVLRPDGRLFFVVRRKSRSRTRAIPCPRFIRWCVAASTSSTSSVRIGGPLDAADAR